MIGMTIVFAMKSLKMTLKVVPSIVNGQGGGLLDHVPRVVVVEFKDIPDLKQYLNRMVDLALAQMKNTMIVILKAAPLVSIFY